MNKEYKTERASLFCNEARSVCVEENADAAGGDFVGDAGAVISHGGICGMYPRCRRSNFARGGGFAGCIRGAGEGGVGGAGAVILHGTGSCGMSDGEKADRKRQGEKGAEVCEGKVRDAGVAFSGGDCAVGGTAGHAAGDEKAPTRVIFR